jgi:hypothetical protein
LNDSFSNSCGCMLVDDFNPDSNSGDE